MACNYKIINLLKITTRFYPINAYFKSFIATYLTSVLSKIDRAEAT